MDVLLCKTYVIVGYTTLFFVLLMGIFSYYHFIMKRIFLLLLMASIGYVPTFSQTDTLIKYYSKNGSETSRDSSFSYAKFFRQFNLWHGVEYYTKRNIVKSEGDYNETNLLTGVGSVNNFKEDGKLDFTVEFTDGKPINKTFFYKSGDKKSYTLYSEKGIQLQKGWDENGKDIKNFVVERDAQFKGGEEGWKKYIEKNLNLSIPSAVGAPPGNYEVQVQFVVDKDGIPVNIKALSVPPKCKACGAETLRVLRESPKWEPAILNNEAVTFETTKTVTFEPVQGQKKG